MYPWGIYASYSMQNGRQTSLSLIGGRQTFASQYDNRNYRLSIRKLKTKHTMKREFKQGDLVLVRSSDLREWVDAILIEVDESLLDAPFLVELTETAKGYYCQCRHIDDFRTGDKVQVRDSMNEEWKDAVYGCLNSYNDFKHYAFIRNNRGFHWKHCRWHPSMPWADKEPLTLEEKVDKMWEQFKTSKP